LAFGELILHGGFGFGFGGNQKKRSSNISKGAILIHIHD
jgi:hypothetical protein